MPEGSEVIHATSGDDVKNRVASTKDKPVVIDFFAKWCGPCTKISPFIQTLAVESKGKAVFLKVDVDELPEVAEEFGISSMPTFVVMLNGKKTEEMIGADSAKLKAMVTKYTVKSPTK